jgi:hypothetical protein
MNLVVSVELMPEQGSEEIDFVVYYFNSGIEKGWCQ